jgi:transposase
MRRAYSVDLRERVVAAYELGEGTDEEVAALFQIGEATVHRWKRLKRETGSLATRPHGGGVPLRIKPEKHDLVRSMFAKEPDLTIPEAVAEFHRQAGLKVSPATMGRTIRALGLTRKKSR